MIALSGLVRCPFQAGGVNKTFMGSRVVFRKLTKGAVIFWKVENQSGEQITTAGFGK